MSCPRDHEILRLVSGELTPAAARGLEEHLAQCAACTAARDEIGSGWRALGDWQVNTSEQDLTGAVLRRIEVDPRQDSPPAFLLAGSGLLRVAASIALAAGLGIATGALVPVWRSTSLAHEDREAVALSLGVAELGVEGSTGLTLGFEPDAADETEGGAP